MCFLNLNFELSFCCCYLVTKSCLTLCNPLDCSPPGSSVRGISKARVLEYSFGNSSCHFLQDPEDLSNPEIEPASPVLQADSLVLNLEGSPELMFITFSFILESSLNLFQPAKIVLNYVSLSPIETTELLPLPLIWPSQILEFVFCNSENCLHSYYW